MRYFYSCTALIAFLGGPLFAQAKPDAKDAPTASDTKPLVVPFDLVSSGHFIVKVKLNGEGPFNLIFDTGAPTTLISPRIAEKAKLTSAAKDKPIIPIFGMMGSVNIKDFQVGDVKAKEAVPAQILDHPTVKLFSQEYEKQYGSIEGIVGFPFFSQYKMTVDYAAKKLTFVPNGYKSEDLMQSMMRSMQASMFSSAKPQPRVLAPAGLWGVELTKKADDDADGVDVKTVVAGSAADVAGLKAGDRILTIDGRWSDTIADAYLATSFVKPGTAAVVVVKRAGKEVKLTVKPKVGL